jgi:serine/threonine-protein phosphatase PP1 catalytic subunit
MKLHITFNGVFNIMPASALINHKVLCMHGGIGPTLSDLRQIRLIPRPTNIGDYGVLCDLLWADPAREFQREMFRFNKGRGVSVVFNETALKTFLTENNLLMIIRAHEVEGDGYRFHFDKKCITVFSATNYGGHHGNKGAVIEMTRIADELKCSFKIFE